MELLKCKMPYRPCSVCTPSSLQPYLPTLSSSLTTLQFHRPPPTFPHTSVPTPRIEHLNACPHHMEHSAFRYHMAHFLTPQLIPSSGTCQNCNILSPRHTHTSTHIHISHHYCLLHLFSPQALRALNTANCILLINSVIFLSPYLRCKI